MGKAAEPDKTLVGKYEAVFFLFMAVLAFLSRENAQLGYPQILYLFLLLMGLNLAAGLSLRRWPEKDWLSVGLVMSNCAAITAILAYSGGLDSNLWVLYLLPIYTACLLLRAQEVALVTAGAICFNAAYTGFEAGSWGATDAFELFLKTALFVLTAAIACKIVSRDRAARRKLQESWRQIEDMSAVAQVGLVSAGVAHDLNNTFAVILGMTEILAAADDVPDSVKTHLERISKSAALGRGIVASFVDMAKKAKAPAAPCDLAELVQSVLTVLKERAAESRVEVQVEFEALAKVEGRRADLQRIFLNLFSNAIRAMDGGGTLTVRGRALLGPQSQWPQVQVTVEDTGPGLPAQMLERLFKPFSSTEQERGGTGLGLYICSEIAAQHGGRLRAENKDGGGARFTLFLPAMAQTGAAEAA